MDDDRRVATLLEQADRHRRAGNHNGAVDLLRRALAIAPDHARAHASLALTLLGMRRLAGAAVEVGLALTLDADDGFCHYAAAAVRRAERELDDAWRHCAVALDADPHDVDIRVLGASIRVLQGDRVAARALLDEALANARARGAERARGARAGSRCATASDRRGRRGGSNARSAPSRRAPTRTSSPATSRCAAAMP